MQTLRYIETPVALSLSLFAKKGGLAGLNGERVVKAERALPIYGIDRGVGEQSGIIGIFHRDKDISGAKGVPIARIFSSYWDYRISKA